METLQEAKAHLRANYEDGVSCPCCGQFVKLYKRKLNSGMSYALLLIYKIQKRLGENEWMRVVDEFTEMKVNVGNTEYQKLAHWGLLEEQMHDTEDGYKRNSGSWRLTQRGKAFAERKLSVNSHVHIYNNKVKGYSDKMVTIDDTLGSKFNYRELMGN